MKRGAALVMMILSAAPCRADDAPAVTSDTLNYCRELARRVSDRHSTLPDVQRLLAEGRDMCERGQLRRGIRRIRRALVILEQKAAPRDQ